MCIRDSLFDRVVVNDLAVNGPANAVRRLGIAMRVHVTGHVYSYAMGMVVGTVVVAVSWWLISTQDVPIGLLDYPYTRPSEAVTGSL